MKIVIGADAAGEGEEIDITLSQDNLDNLNFVDMTIGDEEYTISVDDLFEAMLLFDERRARSLHRDALAECEV